METEVVQVALMIWMTAFNAWKVVVVETEADSVFATDLKTETEDERVAWIDFPTCLLTEITLVAEAETVLVTALKAVVVVPAGTVTLFVMSFRNATEPEHEAEMVLPTDLKIVAVVDTLADTVFPTDFRTRADVLTAADRDLETSLITEVVVAHVTFTATS
jgi:hypothetical protein